jgi:hypothetical protein
MNYIDDANCYLAAAISIRNPPEKRIQELTVDPS